jgi:hypothetical protein
MRRRRCGLFIAAAFAFSLSAADAQQAASTLPPPTVSPAIDGILAAFEKHPLVGLSDNHGSAQEEDFYAAIIRDPRFAHEVGNVVVEFGGAAHQDTIDRYVQGEDVSYAELQKVWTDVVGWAPTVLTMGYMNFYAQVRETNLRLPPQLRIRVLLGEPVIDWSKIKSSADLHPLLGQRDSHAARVIDQEILAKGKKALVIYGGFHFYGDTTLRGLVEADHPSAFFIVSMYRGFVSKSCTGDFEQTTKDWAAPAIAFPVQGTTLEQRLKVPGCDVYPRNLLRLSPAPSEAEMARIVQENEEKASGAQGDALLYLGPAASLTDSPINPIFYLDSDLRKEINRHEQILNGRSRCCSVENSPVSPQYIHH